GGLPYRRGRAELLDAKHRHERVTREAMTTLLSTASRVAALVRRTHPNFSLGVQPDDPPYHVADTLADRLLADPPTRQELLETLDTCERVKKLTGHVAALLGQLEFEHSKGPLQ